MTLIRYAGRPDLLARRHAELSAVTFPAYMHENEPGNLYWGRLYSDFPDFQVALVEGDELLAEAHAVPLPVERLTRRSAVGLGGRVRARHGVARPGDGVDGDRDQRRAGEARPATLQPPDRDLQENAHAAGLSAVIAPVRPTLKERYPLIPIERYLEWRRDDGTHFDPWIRIHERVGGEVLAPAPESMTIRAPASDWETWTGMRFPADGEYILPGGLAPLVIRDGIGVHVEPNVWILHRPATRA